MAHEVRKGNGYEDVDVVVVERDSTPKTVRKGAGYEDVDVVEVERGPTQAKCQTPSVLPYVIGSVLDCVTAMPNERPE